MKNYIHCVAILFSLALCLSCKQQQKQAALPPPVSSVDEVKKIIVGKTWQVVDVATIAGSRKSAFDNDKAKNETVAAPAAEALNWFSQMKGIDTATDFMGSFYKENFIKFKKISLAFNNDSMATATGMDAEQQLFSINNNPKENEPNGIKLTLTGEMTDMGKVTSTYYVLGADQNTLYLLTPNEMNDLKVVFLLKGK